MLLLVALAARAGVRRITEGQDRHNVAAALARLLELSLASGLLALAVTEFLKRLSPLGRAFIARSVDRFTLGRTDFIAAAAEQDTQSLSPSVLAALTALTPVTVVGSIKQVTAQLSYRMRPLVDVVVDRAANSELRLLALRAITPYGFEGRDLVSLLAYFERPYETGLDTREELYSQLDQRLDTFQIETTQRVHRMLRISSSISAAVIAAMSAWAVSGSAAAILVAALFGLVIGGPVSWFARDIIRVFERKAEF